MESTQGSPLLWCLDIADRRRLGVRVAKRALGQSLAPRFQTGRHMPTNSLGWGIHPTLNASVMSVSWNWGEMITVPSLTASTPGGDIKETTTPSGPP